MAYHGHAVAMVRSRKHGMFSLGSLTTLDAFECVSDDQSDVETVSDTPSVIRPVSDGPEPSETSIQDYMGDLDVDGTDMQKALADLGFDEDFTDEPLLTVSNSNECLPRKGEPPAYKNLFWRKYLAAQQPHGKLTAERLEQHEAKQADAFPFGKTFSPRSAGEWLAGIKAFARGVPIREFSTSVFGDDLGIDVADFVGGDAMVTTSEGQGSTIDTGDAPDGLRVAGFRCIRIPAPTSNGRAGFLCEDEVSISTVCGGEYFRGDEDN